MWRNSIVIALAVGFVCNCQLMGQTKKRYTVDSESEFAKLAFKLNAPAGTCQIRPTQHENLVTVYCKSEEDNYNPDFFTHLTQNTKVVSLNLDDGKINNLSSTISRNMFGSKNNELENKCNVYLSHQKPLSLDLKYGVGNAFADLSGLAVERLKINTGSADVTVGYQHGKFNLIQMDTFYIKVDLGSVNAKRLNLSKASNIIADVGFGDLSLDFSDTLMVSTNVNASVGAGTLEVLIGNENTPTIVIIKDSILCRVKLNEHFREIENNVFVNESYSPDADNLITFNLDVAMGNIIFR